MSSSRPTTRSHARAYARALTACLAAGALTFTASCSAFQRPEGASEEISYGGQNGDSGGDKGQPAPSSYSEVSTEISDDQLREIFADGKFSDCKLDQKFYDSAYVDGAKMIPLDSADVYVNEETCSGYVKPQVSGDQPEELKDTSIYAGLSATKHGSNLDNMAPNDAEWNDLSDEGLKGWQSIEMQDMCVLAGPEGTPLEYAEVISTFTCDSVKPLLRSLTNLANRYQELEGKEANIGEADGPLEIGDRVEMDLVDDSFREARDKAKGKDESTTEEVGIGKVEMKLKDSEILIDNPRDYSRLCVEVEYAYEDEAPITPPTEIGVQAPNGEFEVLRAEGALQALSDEGKGSQRYCSEVGIRFGNTDFVVTGLKTLSATKEALEKEGIPLWRIHVERNDDGNYEIS
ncbi:MULTISPECIES: hypothetical protein [unclassified Corynebacterium]|uniref:hypothetical protein n=1 Tax=unclassified Corynebacterium TaxID=2624378 RepID=UPI001EF5CD72|nr:MULTISPECIES: hypothetical protein [unclassified Corynebacterium]MCG7259500.1 hypothetical protein [Corynebacterium sp. ACRQK]MCG7264024.1 hypothetical protein [Corynebacterium sp. ACRQL]